MKNYKINSIFFIFLINIVLFPSVSAWTGNGSIDNPYLMSDCQDLNNMSNLSALSFANANITYFEQINDIDCNNTKWYIDNATNQPYFKPVYDGNFYTISNLSMSGHNLGGSYVSINIGMFRYISNYSIKNIFFENIKINVTKGNSGILIGDGIYGSIENISIKNSKIKGARWIGLLAGDLSHTTVNKIYANGTIIGATTGGLSINIGGLIGYGNADINNSYIEVNYNHNDTTPTTYTRAFTSYGYGGTIQNSYIKKAYNFSGDAHGTITNCYRNQTFNLINSFTLKNGSVNWNNSSQFTVWDFTDVWEIKDGYPALRFESVVSDICSDAKITGNGNQTNPYMISSCEDLQMIDELTDFTSSKYYKLENNINCENISKYTYANGIKGFIPIGYPNLEDSNTTLIYPSMYFDGNFKTISNIYIRNNTYLKTYVGLWSRVNFLNISNLQINNSYIEAWNRVGLIAGWWSGYAGASNIHVHNATVIQNIVASSRTGIITGYTSNKKFSNIAVTDSYIQCHSSSACGGLFGNMLGTSNILKNIYLYNTNLQNTEGILYGSIGTVNSSNIYFWGNTTLNVLYNYKSGTTIWNNIYLLNDSKKTPNMITKVTHTILNKTEMMQQAFYSGFDFINVWSIQENITTPYFKVSLNQSTPTPNNITYPYNNSYIKEIVLITWLTFNDTNNDFDYYNISLFKNGVFNYSINESTTALSQYFNTSKVNDGNYELRIYGYDGQGLYNYSWINITIDNTKPLIFITTPTDIIGLKYINGSISENYPQNVSIDNNSFVIEPLIYFPYFSFRYMDTVSFIGNITITAYDKAGNKEENKSYFIFDIVSPYCTGIMDKNLIINQSYNWIVSCYDDIKLKSFNVSCSGGSTFQYFKDNISNTEFNFSNETGKLQSETICLFTVIDNQNNLTTKIIQRFALKQTTDYMDFNMSQFTSVFLLGIMVFLWVSCMAIGTAFKNFGFMSFGFFIGIFTGLIMANIHIFLCLVFIFLNIVLFISSIKAIK